jgi:FAD/FMN-containing dehydrogenase
VKKYTRKQFIKISSAAGAAFFLGACGLGNNEEKKEETALVPGNPEKTKKAENTSLSFDLVDKQDKRYEDLRRGFNKRIDKYPLCIALCSTTDGVAGAVRYANEKGLAIAVKSGGHSMEGFSCNDGGMVINLSKMNQVEMLAEGKIKTGPGCTLAGLYDSILPQGCILPAGSCATVGLGGLTMGGGYGLFSRKYGLTCDHLLEATMVDGSGNIHTTKNDAELLWALKGGGAGNFGVVTEMIFATHTAPATMQAHYFKARKLNAERATAILQTWMELAPQLPASCFSGYVLNGSTLNIVITNYETHSSALQLQLNKLAEATDEFHSSHTGKLSKMLKNHYGSVKPLYFRNSSAGLFGNYEDISGFIGKIFEKIIDTPGMIYQVNTMGGKVKDTEFEKNSSYPHRNFDFVSELQAYWDKPAQDKRLAEATTEILEITRQQGITRQYVNYCSLEFSDWEKAYYGENYSRLQAVKRKYDPGNNIRHPQSIKI